MEFFRIHRTIPFMRHALILNIISLLTFLAAVFFIATRGFHLSIEFTGGTVMEVHYEQSAPVAEIRTAIDALGSPATSSPSKTASRRWGYANGITRMATFRGLRLTHPSVARRTRRQKASRTAIAFAPCWGGNR